MFISSQEYLLRYLSQFRDRKSYTLLAVKRYHRFSPIGYYVDIRS